MSKNDLEKLKVADLKLMCKERHLTYYHNKKLLTKAEMIAKILDYDGKEFQRAEAKKKYIDEAEPGVLIAFYDESGKPRTAKIIESVNAEGNIKVQTEFGWEFVVPVEKILWVKRGDRWPKGVYKILKGREYEGTNK